MVAFDSSNDIILFALKVEIFFPIIFIAGIVAVISEGWKGLTNKVELPVFVPEASLAFDRDKSMPWKSV